MFNKRIIIPITTLLALSATSFAIAADMPHGGKPMMVMLSGSAEIPGPGDPDGMGMVHLRLNPGRETVCAHFEVTDIQTATAAHIHEAPLGVAGPVLVTLPTPNAQGMAEGCVELAREDILDIMHNPDQYYVNVHNATYPAGAIRGQLGQ